MAKSKTRSEFENIDYPLLIGGLIAVFVAVAAGLVAGGKHIEKWGLAVPGMILIAMGASGVTRKRFAEGIIQLASGVAMNVCALINPIYFWVVTGIVALLIAIALLFFTISAKQKTSTKSTMKYMATIFGLAAGIMLIIAYVHLIGRIGITYQDVYYIMTGVIVGIFGIFIIAASLLVHEK